MKYSTLVSIAAFISTSLAATVPDEHYSTLSPSAKIPSGASTDFSGTFGIQVVTVESASALSTDTATSTLTRNDNKKEATPVAQITDGQVQHQTTGGVSAIKQISDGQVQHQTNAAQPIAQISDGQIQHQTTAKATATPVQQINDGQIQHQTTVQPVAQISDGQIQHQTAKATATPVQQIGDGQIQHQTTVQPVAQISDGQIQHQTVKASATPVQQIGDGQIQHQTTAAAATTASAVKQINDGQIQHQTTTAENVAKAQSDGQAIATGSPSSNSTLSDDDDLSSTIPKACSSANNLEMTLHDSVLKDTHERWGAIVANHQFQFDGPIPQAGTIYSAGWSIKDGYLYLGDSNIFYQCLSGDFYNLYDENVAKQCSAVKLSVIEFVNC
ncbi:hypothetical protein MEM_02286 [Candida albicans L26]|uniref:Cell wall mannoprotein PIR1 n=3 Tax=Candida albicans TaxID=5476 RepID=PIR1_CANAL|nr:beta-1,3-glucan linked protein [Candida albicans SC5314]Q59SF7.2 RecName: Full=Cell wall mannoprotein PIR1; AltName: Full=Protein with internal repeats 1; Flags: Precursor [Candida albicans SC5314]KGQ95876.1 hypothetical protein MEU_02277 [Candida albicans P37005]KGT70428.1 hypothetical protein MEK_02286 [Candida albicans 12C]KGU15662.1 hypothetical protein MEM_02286 [Candida albicans L26]KHC57985.1 hypothetical protein MGC_02274 [Candida albicans P37039]KHC65971.1 hypothetical protein MGE|eukprot:XP_712603.2 beta-1,3-glucan linked protein [Candida albicans SC5314]